MATLISRADGNFTTAATWGVADTTMLQETYNATSLTTTGNQDSLGFTTGAITVDGMIAHVLRVNTTGTVTFSLWNSTDSTTAATVTVNASDLPVFGPVLLSFGAVTLLASKSYKLRITASSAGNYSIYRSTANSTAWDVLLRTTTTAAPAAGDRFYTIGDWTAAATYTARSVTMDNTATTIFGATSYLGSFWIGSKGTLAYGTSASTNYYLKYRGSFRVTGDGTFTIGTSASRIPSTSTAVLEMDSVANVDTGLLIQAGGTFKTGGATKTTKAYIAAHHGGICNTSGTTVTRRDGPAFNSPLLSGTFYVNGTAYTISSVTNADTLILTGSVGSLTAASWAPASTTLTTDVSTSWKASDEVVMANTSRANLTSCEKRSLSIDASGTTLTFATNVVYGKSADTELKSEVINITRNVKIRGMSVSLCGYILAQDNTTIERDYDETYYFGSNTVNKYGVEVGHVTAGSYSETGCANHDYTTTTAYGSAYRVTSIAVINQTLSDNNYFNAGYVQFFSIATTYSNCSYDSLWFMANTAQVSYGLYSVQAINADFTNIRIIGGASFGFYYSPTSPIAGSNIIGTLDNIVSKVVSISITGATGVIGDLAGYRALTHGVALVGCKNLTIGSITGKECAAAALTVTNLDRCVIKSLNSQSGACAAPYGLYVLGACPDSVINDGLIGTSVAVTTADLVFTGINANINFNNTQFGSTTELSTGSNWFYGAWYGNQNYDAVAGDNRQIRWEGTLQKDTTIYNTASPALRMTPSRADYKLESNIFLIPVESGNTSTIQVEVRKSSAGDGTAYTGAQPRLMLKANPSLGVDDDTVLATYSAGTGSWNTLSGSTPSAAADGVWEVYVDCDGTAGWINVEDIASSIPNPSGFKFFKNGIPAVNGVVVVTPTDVGLPFIGG
jgi:hypothetical protein